MLNRNNQLFVSDLDDTLLNRYGELVYLTKHRLAKYLRAGLAFTVATSRTCVSVKPIFNDISITLPIIEQNGGLVTIMDKYQRLFVNSMKSTIAIPIIKLLLEQHHSFFVSCYHKTGVFWFYHKLHLEEIQFFMGKHHTIPKLCYPINLSQLNQCNLLSVFCLNTSVKIKNLFKKLNSCKSNLVDIFTFKHQSHADLRWLCIHDKKATKGHALKQLLTLFHPVPQNIYVFGNEKNDISMLKEKHFIACVVDNAPESIKLYAQHIIPSNEKDGVMTFIEKKFK
jgi:hypothetical protein